MDIADSSFKEYHSQFTQSIAFFDLKIGYLGLLFDLLLRLNALEEEKAFLNIYLLDLVIFDEIPQVVSCDFNVLENPQLFENATLEWVLRLI